MPPVRVEKADPLGPRLQAREAEVRRLRQDVRRQPRHPDVPRQDDGLHGPAGRQGGSPRDDRQAGRFQAGH